jgi:hypothetical protein
MLENKDRWVAGAAGKIACDCFKEQLVRRFLNQAKLVRFHSLQKLLVKNKCKGQIKIKPGFSHG